MGENSGGGDGTHTTCSDAWDKLLTTDRFELVMNDEAVLDHETCLVWEQSPDTTNYIWTSALAHCFTKIVGGRHGWRAPTIEELTTLIDHTQAAPAIPAELSALTSNVQSSFYWSSTTDAFNSFVAWLVDSSSGIVALGGKGAGGGDSANIFVWCVRGGQ